MVGRAAAWAESVGLFVLLYAGVPLAGIAIDGLVGWSAFPLAIRLLGIAPLALGAFGIAWCFSLFVRLGRGTPNPWRPPQALVTRGPFAATRNPIILSHALAAFGEALVVGSPAAALIVLAVGLPIQGVVRHEEAVLEARYGEAYRDYRRRVPRWIPRLRGQRR